jgi:hypothetical protein
MAAFESPAATRTPPRQACDRRPARAKVTPTMGLWPSHHAPPRRQHITGWFIPPEYWNERASALAAAVGSRYRYSCT